MRSVPRPAIRRAEVFVYSAACDLESGGFAYSAVRDSECCGLCVCRSLRDDRERILTA